VGLGAGVSYILSEGVEKIRAKEIALTQCLIKKLSEIPEIEIYGPKNAEKQVGVVSINVADYAPEEIGYTLDETYGIMVRTGLHCAPCAHRTIGTIERGTLRIGLGYFNTEEEIDYLIQSIKSIVGKRR
jgi:selenocysteine lyase/cysteine desulfurase